MNETEQFLADNLSIVDQPLTPEVKPEEAPVAKDPDDPELQPEGVKNRRHKKLEERLQAEREANIAMAARLEAMAEATKGKDEGDYLKVVERIYGTDTPEAVAATELLRTALLEVEERSFTRAVEKMREEQQEFERQKAAEDSTLDDMVDEIEEHFGVKMTPQLQESFFAQLEKLSPKDKNGNVTEYADPIAVWEFIQPRKTESTRAKDLASRSMTTSATSTSTSTQDDAVKRMLRAEGIL